MKANEFGLLDFLKKSSQFVIPIYQRTYSWTDKECRQLWDDIVRTGSRDDIAVHFVGSVVYIEAGLSNVSHQSPLLVIDGQQRLTTVTLLLAALSEVLGDTEPVDGFSARKLRHYYLLNPEEGGERRYKLLLSQTDKDTLLRIVESNAPPREPSLRVTRAFELFNELVTSRSGELVDVCNGLAKLVIVDVALNRDYDNPQLIFESMNSTGRQLSQADLIRNFVLMGLAPDLQTQLYENYWRPMELQFGQEAYGSQFDGFMRHYLTVKTGDIPNVGEVYEAFKEHARTSDVDDAGVEVLVRDIRDFARYFCAMALSGETVKELAIAFQDLRELRVDVAYPLLLELYRDYDRDVLSRADFLAAVRLIEAYVFRRAICAIPTNSLNKTFSTFAKSLDRSRYLESIEAHLQLMPSYRRFPSDEEFQRELRTRDVYNFRSRSYFLRRLENHGRKERVPVDEYTIEHILPQNPDLSADWRAALGADWQSLQETWLHTLGNLTLTGYNSEYSDRPFAEKRDMAGGFRDSPLKLNAGLGALSHWNQETIEDRAGRLARVAVDVWAFQKLAPDKLEPYAPESSSKVTYTVADHHHLQAPEARELYEALRTEVVALDPCVTEEILKLYIAFKAETNFVDVIPQAKRLVLSLKIAPTELDDPRDLGRDVSELGHWGTGDVEVDLASLHELPYIMGLIRQALELQLGDRQPV
jgi:uncharacterized protein with ParB-like and HNH nuclease domain/predicted transport protein